MVAVRSHFSCEHYGSASIKKIDYSTALLLSSALQEGEHTIGRSVEEIQGLDHLVVMKYQGELVGCMNISVGSYLIGGKKKKVAKRGGLFLAEKRRGYGFSQQLREEVMSIMNKNYDLWYTLTRDEATIRSISKHENLQSFDIGYAESVLNFSDDLLAAMRKNKDDQMIASTVGFMSQKLYELLCF